MQTDAILLEQYVVTRSAEAFREIVQRYAGLVFGTAMRVTSDPVMAEDVAQDCFFRFSQKADQVKGSLAGWLHQVALNQARRAMRTQTRRQRHEQAVEVKVSDTEESAIEWSDISPVVDDALAALPEELREPLVAHYLAGRSQEEVAGQLGIHQGTVSRRIDKGIEQVRDHLRSRGIVVPAVGVLATLLTNHAAEAAPTSLTTALGKMTLATTTAAGSTVAGITVSKLALVAGVAAIISVGAIYGPRLVTSNHASDNTINAGNRAMQHDAAQQGSFKEPRIVELQTIKLLGLQERFVNGQEDHEGIWKRFMDHIDQIKPHSVDGAFYGANFATESKQALDYLAGMAVGDVMDVPEGLTLREMPASHYAVFECTVGEIGATWQYILGQWLQTTPYDMPPMSAGKADFERYPPETGSADTVVRLHLAIEDKAKKIDVVLVDVPGMKVASCRMDGPNPEEKAHEKLQAWARKNGLLNEHKPYHFFGFNNPTGLDGQPHGYELWLPLDRDVPASDGIVIKNFEGAPFLARTMTMAEFITPGKGWDLLHPGLPWFSENDYVFAGEAFPFCLEETVFDPQVAGRQPEESSPIVLYMRLKKK